ncbi:N-acetyltransferase family protein [Geodermatophilus sp. SYSU D00710]
MIRPAVVADTAGIVAVAVASGLFPPEEVGIVEDLLTGPGGPDGALCLVDDEQGVRGVAYAEPVRGTEDAWELTMIAVAREVQGGGRGTALLRAVEDGLRPRGARLLLVMTSGTPEFARTRAFYAGRGYGEEARVRDYYTDGDDMVLFRLPLKA